MQGSHIQAEERLTSVHNKKCQMLKENEERAMGIYTALEFMMELHYLRGLPCVIS